VRRRFRTSPILLVDPEGAAPRSGHAIGENQPCAAPCGVILHVLYAEDNQTLTRCGTESSPHPRQSFEKRWHDHEWATNHLGTPEAPTVHPVVGATARELAQQIGKMNAPASPVTAVKLFFVPLTASTIGRKPRLVTGGLPGPGSRPTRPSRFNLVRAAPSRTSVRTKPLIRLILNQDAARPHPRRFERPRLGRGSPRPAP